MNENIVLKGDLSVNSAGLVHLNYVRLGVLIGNEWKPIDTFEGQLIYGQVRITLESASVMTVEEMKKPEPDTLSWVLGYCVVGLIMLLVLLIPALICGSAISVR